MITLGDALDAAAELHELKGKRIGVERWMALKATDQGAIDWAMRKMEECDDAMVVPKLIVNRYEKQNRKGCVHEGHVVYCEYCRRDSPELQEMRAMPHPDTEQVTDGEVLPGVWPDSHAGAKEAVVELQKCFKCSRIADLCKLTDGRLICRKCLKKCI